MRELRNRIAVGLDHTPAAHCALTWAVREAIARRATLLVITAWTGEARAAARERGDLVAERRRLQGMQRAGFRRAMTGIAMTGIAGTPPLVAWEIVLADAVTALSHAATFADTLVVGAHHVGGRTASTADLLARRLAKHGEHIPVVAVDTEDCAGEPVMVGAA
jgi:hypothetical protein